MNKIYEKLMRKCISLAKHGKGKVEPNPCVGAIVYDEKKEEIISTGYHKGFGKPHAEVEAIKNTKGNTKGKTIIVNLEPCSHFGKTPPCADLIIKSGFKKVIVGMIDPNPLVQGKGIKKLKEAGIEVAENILEKDCRELNKVFIKNILYKKPYVMLKTATTLDSKITDENQNSKWITNELSRSCVQKLRSSYQAIMTGSGTIIKDNPQMNVRIKNKKSPVRIIFDPHNKLNFNYNVFKNDGVRIILVNNSNIKTPENVEKIEFSNFDSLFRELYKRNIFSIMVEAGTGLNSMLLKEREIDEINQFISNKIFGSGKPFVDIQNKFNIDYCIELKDMKIEQFEDNFLINGKIIK